MAEIKSTKSGNLLSGFLFGIAFGFLLHKAGVSDYNVLIGVLRLTDLTVIQVILSAILVGSIALFLLGKLGTVRPHTKPTQYANNIIGGLIFGIGFGLWGYCPGTGAAALGQGSWDAAWGIGGMIIGSYIYANAFGLSKKLLDYGDKGKLTVPELAHIPQWLFLVISSVITIIILFLLQ